MPSDIDNREEIMTTPTTTPVSGEARASLEFAAQDRHGPIEGVAEISDAGLRLLAATPAAGQFWPGCTAEESEWLNNKYYRTERADGVRRILYGSAASPIPTTEPDHARG